MNYNQLQIEVKDLIDEINKDSQNMNKPSGWRIMYSPVMPYPEVVLIGINPGSGIANATIFDPNEKLEYLVSVERNYQIAGQTVRLFQAINKYDILKSSTAKTNVHYFVSNDLNEHRSKLKDIKDTLSRLGASKNYYFEKVEFWTRMLITQIMQPKIIICEGKASYDFILNILTKDEDWGREKQWNGVCGYVHRNGKVIFGYSRRYSIIKDFAATASLLHTAFEILRSPA